MTRQFRRAECRKEVIVWFRGLRKLRHVVQAIVANELGHWPHNDWPLECGNRTGKLLLQFREEDHENFDIEMDVIAQTAPWRRN